MIKYSTQVEGYGGQLKTTVTIGHQTFTIEVAKLDRMERKEMSQREYQQWYADQMKKALDNLVNSIKNENGI